MRGKAADLLERLTPTGITPAYAGKSRQILDTVYICQDHPRLCGEKEMKSSPISSPIGSPPPMRGKEILRQFGVPLCRITPAYAGKSAPLARNLFTGEDHPRLCGEKFRFGSL